MDNTLKKGKDAMDMREKIGSAIFFMVFSILYFFEATQIKLVNIFGVTVVSSATIPKVLGILLLFLSTVYLVKSLIELKNASKTGVIEEKEKAASQEKQEGASGIVISDRGVDISKSLEEAEKNETVQTDLLSIILTLGVLFLFAFLLDKLGFILSACIYMVLQALILTKKEERLRRLPLILVISAVFSIAVYMLFTRGLSLMLPSGILG